MQFEIYVKLVQYILRGNFYGLIGIASRTIYIATVYVTPVMSQYLIPDVGQGHDSLTISYGKHNILQSS